MKGHRRKGERRRKGVNKNKGKNKVGNKRRKKWTEKKIEMGKDEKRKSGCKRREEKKTLNRNK